MDQKYFSTILRALSTQNAELICSCLTLDESFHYGGKKTIEALICSKADSVHVFPEQIRSMEDIVFAHVKSLRSLQQQNYSNVWKMQKQGLDILVNFIPELGSDWLIPLIIQYIKESRLVTYKISNAVESKEIAECTMAIRNVATAFNTRKDVVYGSTNGFISISLDRADELPSL